ncbi:CDP-diacylglycerol--serine O-phosphatidyltransferase (EC [Bathymodiolus thermophilus thioautotrophic gill symbiont]|uniref:CDP-diacylglycerol--serine O-phosphatidyltransferase (EC) n=2 Tax=Bathymodiolus thermophilus thioautotrophic gill symbiont TaxID=2360 RepID=A0A8H8XG16_9GAMM|nr:CDP-alcohol phosphatidyltransferase family protein [Bathymodiolus thermophilus thioautotrophic gill symbiont]CAB5499058.1 CDP-diacylglycerol--serine O-phosphatidyltransferase (EC [Bathymodiolus thermophilus thioautotrophic gill symbiont]CAB5502964.1 CDP-diacylglycerol--serine O-phosphatidyltransferase (EC [Bathymodiolus thermophilus thioautotrophic gill symbiont]
MTMTGKVKSEELQPTILSFVKDLPNLCSLAGLACTILAIYFSILGVYHAAMIGMIWAVAFDWADGLIARKMKGRTSKQGFFGGQLDSLIDVVNYGVAPAILLLSYGKFSPIFLLGAFIIISASAIRLSYFNTYGLSNGTRYTGMALDNNSIILVFVFLFENTVSVGVYSIILYVVCLLLSALNVSEIKTPKLSGNPVSVYMLAIYTLGITGIYGWKLL